MFQSFFKRLLVMIPTFLGISLIVFFISTKTPGDPVQLLLEQKKIVIGNESSKSSLEKRMNTLREAYHFDAPLFYFKITDYTQTDTLHKINNKSYRENLSDLSFEHGKWKAINEFNKEIDLLHTLAYGLKDVNQKNRILQFIERLKKSNNSKQLTKQLLLFKKQSITNVNIRKVFDRLESIIIAISSHNYKLNRYIPKFIWFGLNNQYHYWISNLLTGNLGDSYVDKVPVVYKIRESARWTILLSILSIIISYLIAVPLGVFLAKNKGSTFSEFTGTILFAIHCIPTFWMASLLVIFFASPEYFELFPSYGLGFFGEGQSIWDKFTELSQHLVLPLICYSYSSIAYISEQTKRSIIHIDNQNYIQTARAKGLKNLTIYRKHILYNTSFTLITQLGNLIPAIISGSFVVEYIFAIPGMGKLLVDSIHYRDYPTLFATIMISSILVMIGILISDMLYVKFDPRVNILKDSKL